MKHRRRVDILADVLTVAGKGARKTRIMREANLSYDLLKKYLGQAVNSALLQSNNYGFKTTEKGQKFLEQYKQLYEEYSKVGSNYRSVMQKWEVLERASQNSPEKDYEKDVKRSSRMKTSAQDGSKCPS
jgi:predicted transcriptional regulator